MMTARPRSRSGRIESRSHLVCEHDPFGKPVSTLRFAASAPDDAPANSKKPVDRERGPAGFCNTINVVSALGVLLEELGRVANRQDGLRGVIGNLAAEFFFERHDQLDRVEAVSAEVVDEARVVDHFLWLDTKVLDYDFFNPLANLTHRSTSCLFP